MTTAYATQQDLVTRFGEEELVSLTDRTNSNAIDAAVVARALADAAAEIDGYLRGRYALPLDPMPRDVARPACDIARYRLFGSRVTDEVRRRYEDAVGWLKDVAAGRVQLTTDTNDAPVTSAGGPRAQSPGRTFTLDTLKDFA